MQEQFHLHTLSDSLSFLMRCARICSMPASLPGVLAYWRLWHIYKWDFLGSATSVAFLHFLRRYSQWSPLKLFQQFNVTHSRRFYPKIISLTGALNQLQSVSHITQNAYSGCKILYYLHYP